MYQGYGNVNSLATNRAVSGRLTWYGWNDTNISRVKNEAMNTLLNHTANGHVQSRLAMSSSFDCY